MAIVIQQVTVNATTPTYLGSIPNGPCSVVITNPNNADLLIGLSSNLTQNNGLSIPPNQRIEFCTFPSSKGTSIYGLVATGGTTGPASMLISTTD